MGLPRQVRLHRREISSVADGLKFRQGSGPITVTALVVLPSDGDLSPEPLARVSSSRRAVGFAIGKAVGSAVVRNRIRRRLRVGVRSVLSDASLRWPDGETLVVVRVSPAAATLQSAALHEHVRRALGRAVGKAADRSSSPPAKPAAALASPVSK